MYFENGERGQEPKNAGGLEKLEKARKWIFPLDPSEGMSFC